jgi:hypothetical protein
LEAITFIKKKVDFYAWCFREWNYSGFNQEP